MILGLEQDVKSKTITASISCRGRKIFFCQKYSEDIQLAIKLAVDGVMNKVYWR